MKRSEYTISLLSLWIGLLLLLASAVNMEQPYMGPATVHIPFLALLLGATMAILVVLTIYFALMSRMQTRKLQKALNDLSSTQENLLQQEKLASLGAITAGIAHEIRNPINFIVNFAEVSTESIQSIKEIIHSQQLSAEQQQELEELLSSMNVNLDVIKKQGRKVSDIIHCMLNQARTGAREQQLVQIAPLLEEYLNLFWHGIRAQHPGFSLKIDRVFDPATPPLPIIAEDIARVLLNLLSNAFYAVSQKRQQLGAEYTPTIVVSLRRAELGAEITVWDNGIGISEEAKGKLFTPFFTTKPPREGTGLGLILCYNIVCREHKGKISFDSTVGEYSTFTITLPYRQENKAGSPHHFEDKAE